MHQVSHISKVVNRCISLYAYCSYAYSALRIRVTAYAKENFLKSKRKSISNWG